MNENRSQEEMRELMKQAGINVTGKIRVGGKVIEGDQVNVVNNELNQEEIKKFKIKMEEDSRVGRIETEDDSAFTSENAPEEIFSDDFVSGKIIKNGIIYRLDRDTIDRPSNYRYVRVKE
jgi:hypothetical protein